MSLIMFSSICERRKMIAMFPSDKDIKVLIQDKMLPKLEGSEDHLRTLNMDNMNIHLKSKEGVLYFCIAERTLANRVCWNFINDIENRYSEMDDKCGSKVQKMLKKNMDFHNNPANDKIAHIKEKLDDIKDQMIDNVEKLIDRGEKLEDLKNYMEDVANSAGYFTKQNDISEPDNIEPDPKPVIVEENSPFKSRIKKLLVQWFASSTSETSEIINSIKT